MLQLMKSCADERIPKSVAPGEEIFISIRKRMLQWYSISGTLLMKQTSDFNGRAEAPQESGLWIAVWSKEGERRYQVVVVD